MKVFEVEELEIDVKRFYIDGLIMTKKCKGCGSDVYFSKDKGNYLSYPKVNEEIEVPFYCGNCGEENLTKIKLELTVKIDCEEVEFLPF